MRLQHHGSLVAPLGASESRRHPQLLQFTINHQENEASQLIRLHHLSPKLKKASSTVAMDCAPASNPQDAVQDLLPEGPLPYLGVLEISQDLLPDMEFIECPTAKESEPLSQEYFDELLSEVSSEDSSLLGTS